MFSDPRISTLRPGYLSDDEEWSNQLQAMTLDDVYWLEHQWEIAGGSKPQFDTSWLKFDYI